jgi:superfamily I DNA and/or RNA helicase
MDAAQLPKTGRSLIAQSLNSLFDFAEKRPMGRRLFLADQFRSAPGIVDYINQEFYAGRLVARREADDLRLPRAYKPGLGWHDVKGRPSREDGGNVNLIEAGAVVDLVVDMVRQCGFDGAIGVLSPFDAQVGRITRLAKERLSADERARVSLKVATIDKFSADLEAERARTEKAIEAFASLAERLDMLAVDRARPWWRRLMSG